MFDFFFFWLYYKFGFKFLEVFKVFKGWFGNYLGPIWFFVFEN